MSKLGIFTGTSPNDSTGDTLSQGAVKINSNFDEIYNAIGDGTNITNRIAFASTAGIATNVIGGIASVTNFSASGISTIRTLGVTGLSTANNFTVTGIATFTNGPLLVGSATLTGTATQRLQVTGGAYVSGNLGVGRTNPGTALEINQAGTEQFRVFAAGSGYFLAGYDQTNSRARIGGYSGSAWTTLLLNEGGGNVIVGSTSATGTASQPLQVSGGAYVSGNLGVGTTNPQHKLDVSGDIRSSGTIYGNVATAITATNVIGGIASVTQLNVSGVSTISVNSSSDAVRITQLGAGNALVVEDSANPDATPFVVTASGSVGIGTTNPSRTLDIRGDARVGHANTAVLLGGDAGRNIDVGAGSTNLDCYVDFYGTPTYTDYGGRLIRIAGDNSNFDLANRGTGALRIISQDNGTIDFLTNSTFRARIDSNGTYLIGSATSTGTATQRLQVTGGAYVSENLGIGTTNPSSLLSVDGSTTIGTRLLDMTGVSSTFTTVGSNTFVVPAGVTKISAVLIGGGGAGGGGSAGGSGAGGQGGGGGGLVYINDFTVTPGQSLTINVGAGGAGGTGNGGDGGNSSITGIVTAFGGKGGAAGNTGSAIGVGGTGIIVSSGIGRTSLGGSGGTATLNAGAGGGGAAGYSGNGGNGGNGSVSNGGAAGSGGAAGGGGAPTASGSGGGGVGVLGQGTSGTTSNGVGNAGSDGFNGSLGNTGNGAAGGNYGGGGGGGDGNFGSVTTGGNGAQGIVRIIWSPSSKFSRLFPTNQVGNSINQ